MTGPHCPQCADYETKAMARAPGTDLAPDVKPCDAYAMSDAFRDWAVARMQDELKGQVAASGLGRMAILKRPSGKGPDAQEQQHRAGRDQ